MQHYQITHALQYFFSLTLIIGLWTLHGCANSQCLDDNECGAGWSCESGACVATPVGVDETRASRECALPRKGDLVLNEFLANPNGKDVNGDGIVDTFEDEFVELLNIAPIAVNLSGVGIRVGNQIRHRFEGGCLAAGLAAVVFGGGKPGSTPAAITVPATEALRLTNSGTSLMLVDRNDEVLDSLIYGREAVGSRSWTRVPDGTGPWAGHPAMADGEMVVHSVGACINAGLFPDCVAPTQFDDGDLIDERPCPIAAAGDVVINELLADPGGVDANADGMLVWQHDEFVELVMLAPEPRSLKGCTLRINGRVRATLPGVCLSKGSSVVIFGGGEPEWVSSATRHILVADKTLTLPNAGGVVTIERNEMVLARAAYGSEGGKDQSLTRFPDGVGPFVLHTKTPSGFTASPGYCVNGADLDKQCAP